MLKLVERADVAAFERKIKKNVYMRILYEACEGTAYIGGGVAAILRGKTLCSTAVNKEVLSFATLLGARLLVPSRSGFVFAKRECAGTCVFSPPCYEDAKKLFSILEECNENDGIEFDEFYTLTFRDFSSGKRHFVADEFSCAMTLFESKHSAYITGVCTLPKFRRMGHALNAVERLCEKLGGKTAYLLYDKKYAGLYERAGFAEVCHYKFI